MITAIIVYPLIRFEAELNFNFVTVSSDRVEAVFLLQEFYCSRTLSVFYCGYWTRIAGKEK